MINRWIPKLICISQYVFQPKNFFGNTANVMMLCSRIHKHLHFIVIDCHDPLNHFHEKYRSFIRIHACPILWFHLYFHRRLTTTTTIVISRIINIIPTISSFPNTIILIISYTLMSSNSFALAASTSSWLCKQNLMVGTLWPECMIVLCSRFIFEMQNHCLITSVITINYFFILPLH